MDTYIQNYTDRGIYTFTFEGLTAEINDKGKVVKKAHGFPNWKSINQNNFTEYLYYHHRGLAVMTGKMSNITGFDFDNKEEYEKMIDLHPELKNNYTVQTNKGYHIYFKYNETIKGKITCECGCILAKSCIKRHQNSAKHNDLINNLEINRLEKD